MEIILDNDAHTLLYDNQRRTVRHILKKSNTESEWRALLTSGLNLLKERKVSKWLSDNRKNTLHPDGIAFWVENIWIRDAKEAGWQKWALVESKSKIGKISEEQFIESFMEAGIEVRVFSSLEEAENWI